MLLKIDCTSHVDVAEKMGRVPWFQLGALPIFVSKLFGGVFPGNLETIVATPLLVI